LQTSVSETVMDLMKWDALFKLVLLSMCIS